MPHSNTTAIKQAHRQQQYHISAVKSVYGEIRFSSRTRIPGSSCCLLLLYRPPGAQLVKVDITVILFSAFLFWFRNPRLSYAPFWQKISARSFLKARQPDALSWTAPKIWKAPALPKIDKNLSVVMTMLYEANHIITEMNSTASTIP